MKEICVVDRDVSDVIREMYDAIFPAERKVADFVLEHIDDAVQYNVSELAKASGVSDATIIRMCHHLGYSGYYQFRLALSRDVGRMQSQDSSGASSQDVLQPLFEGYVSTITSIGRGLQTQKLLECISWLKNAGTVHIISVGNTTNVASYLGFRLERLGVRCTSDLQPERFINHISLADEDDIILAITKSGSSKRVLDGMKLAKEKNLKVIVITAHSQSPASELADCVLDCSGSLKGSELFKEHKKGYSYLNEFVMAETLVNIMANEDWLRVHSTGSLEWVLAESKL